MADASNEKTLRVVVPDIEKTFAVNVINSKTFTPIVESSKTFVIRIAE